jgi:hypothetical protein
MGLTNRFASTSDGGWPLRKCGDESHIARIDFQGWRLLRDKGGSPVFAGTDFLITVSGDLLRTNAYIFAHNGILGYTTSKKIKLPTNWRNLIREVE